MWFCYLEVNLPLFFSHELLCHLIWSIYLLILPTNIYWAQYAAAAAKSLQSCPTLCNSIDGSLPGSTVPGILQAGTLEWVAISFSNGWKWKMKAKSLSHVWLLATPWTAAYQAPLSMRFSRQEYWSGVPLSSPEHSICGSYSSFLHTGYTTASSSRNVNKSLSCGTYI